MANKIEALTTRVENLDLEVLDLGHQLVATRKQISDLTDKLNLLQRSIVKQQELNDSRLDAGLTPIYAMPIIGDLTILWDRKDDPATAIVDVLRSINDSSGYPYKTNTNGYRWAIPFQSAEHFKSFKLAMNRNELDDIFNVVSHTYYEVISVY